MTKVCNAINRRDLLAALAVCGRVVPRRAVNEVMTCVRIGDGLASATDGEMRVEVPTPAAGEPVLLPFSRLEALTRACTGEQVEIDPEGDSVAIRASRGLWRLPTRSPDEWPTVPDLKWSPVARLPSDQLARCLSAVVDACDRDSSRYALGGVKIEVIDGVVHLVATDGRRLHATELEIDQAVDDCELLITERAASLLGYLAAQVDEGEEIQLERAGPELRAVVGSGEPVTLYARQLEGNFPKWQQVIPATRRAKPTIVRADKLHDAIRQAAICTSDASRAISLTLGEVIVAEATSSEHGNSRVELEPKEAGHPVTLNVDPRFCCEWLRHVDAVEPVEVEGVDAGSALVFRSEDSTGVVMPMGDD